MIELDNFLKKLEANKKIDSILVMGSIANKSATNDSYIDLVIILKDSPTKLYTVFTEIDNKIADIYFFDIEEIRDILQADYEIEVGSIYDKLISWTRNGEIIKDSSKVLRSFKDKDFKYKDNHILKYQIWFSINFNYAHNLRYFNSKKENYLEALRLRLNLYCVSDLFFAYFTLRNLRFEGEKKAYEYLRDHNPEFLNLFNSFSSTDDLRSKFEMYEKLIDKTLTDEYPLWPRTHRDDYVLVKDQQEIKELDKAKDYWDDLVDCTQYE